MGKNKKTFVIIISVLALLVILFFVAKAVITNRVENRLHEVLGESSNYEELDVSLLQREISLKGLNYNKRGNTVHAERISMSGIGFFKYLTGDQLHIDSFTFEDPEIIISRADSTAKKSSEKEFSQNISIGKIKATNGTFKLRKEGTKGNEVYFRFPKLQISKVEIDSSSLQQSIPFKYKSYLVKGDSLRLNLNAEHFVAASRVNIDNGKTSVKDFRIIPYYDKNEFDRNIPYEKDRVSLRVENVNLDSLSFEFKDGSLYLHNPNMAVSGANLQVYRNKSLPDDPSRRELYSQLLRKAPVKLDFAKVTVKNSHIGYEEKMKEQRPPASVVFDIRKADIENITNIGLDRKDLPRTKVHVEATFQEVAPLSVDWSFDTANPNDRFKISGKFGAVPGDALNSLLRPAMSMEAKGTIKDTWFNFSGNDERLTGEVRLNYDQFKFVWLEKGKREKKGLFTAIANLFVDNDGISGDDVTKEVSVERDVHISFWAYVWSGLRSGVRETFSQL
ncbi:MAG: hypothetical protein WBL27_00525 [Salinimicrobium sp.]